jgi:hypothetical protein
LVVTLNYGGADLEFGLLIVEFGLADAYLGGFDDASKVGAIV